MHEIESENSQQTAKSDFRQNKGTARPLSGIYILNNEHKNNHTQSIYNVPFFIVEGRGEGTI